jgi:hypothetical protein
LQEKSQWKKTESENAMAEANSQNRKNYSLAELILGNGAIVLWIGLGAISCALFYPLSGVLFFGLAAFLVFYELGKHGCVTCYFCKTCTIGMGKLPYLFFKKEGTANVNKRALKIFPFIYLFLSVLPLILIVISLFQGVAVYKVALLASVFAYSVYTGIIRRETLFS